MKAIRKYVVEIGAGILQTIFFMTPVVLALFTIAFAYMGARIDAWLMAVALLAYVLKSRMLRDEAAGHRLTKQRVADAGRLAEAATAMASDYQTSTDHHPHRVLVRVERFDAMRAALTAHQERKASAHG